MRLTRGVPQGSRLWPLLFIATVDSLTSPLNCAPVLHLVGFARDLTIACPRANLSEIQQTIKKGLDCTANWSAKCYMKVSAEKTEYMLFNEQETNLLNLKVGATVLKEVRGVRLFGLTMQTCDGLSEHALSTQTPTGTRLMHSWN
ncbi:putative Reverse transcriptase (RNA dependent DNA polymerase) [Trypanosoma vivax]|nr:hypothetical protein TRVL_06041 [Trypanosoma vivax]KAH8604858.1 putative Reverse transcriptase (RNA dependent DNA polymerase) [Trypanosoma vivax]